MRGRESWVDVFVRREQLRLFLSRFAQMGVFWHPEVLPGQARGEFVRVRCWFPGEEGDDA